MKVYDKLAEYYDLIFTANYEEEAEVVDEIIKSSGIKGKRLLDVGCATGGHMVAFKELGYEVEGLDMSNEMIKQAKKKLPKTVFHKQRMSKMKTRKNYDVIIILNRSLLYVKNKKELRKLLWKAYKHLDEKGILVLDLDLHEDYFDPDRSDANYFKDDEVEGSVIIDYDQRGNKVLWSANLSISDGEIKRLVHNHEYLMINTKKLLKLMKDMGYRTSVYDMNGRKTKKQTQPLIIGGVKHKKGH